MRVRILARGYDLMRGGFAAKIAACAVVGATPDGCNPCQFVCGNYCCASNGDW